MEQVVKILKKDTKIKIRKKRFFSIELMYKILIYSMVAIFAAFIIFPFFWLILSSFKSKSEIFSRTIIFLPTSFSFENYISAFTKVNFVLYFKNTFIVAAITVISQIIFCSMAGYAFGLMDFTGKEKLFFIIVIALIIPLESTIISNFVTVKKLNLVNSFYGIAILRVCSTFGVFIMRQFYKTMPNEISEAARIDGCNEFYIYTKLMLPLSKGPIATLAIFAFLDAWNGYMWPLVVTNKNSMRTIQVAIKYLIDPELGTDWPSVMAASTIVILPVFLIFIFLQKYFVEGISKNGLK